jgi:hypothetical protein
MRMLHFFVTGLLCATFCAINAMQKPQETHLLTAQELRLDDTIIKGTSTEFNDNSLNQAIIIHGHCIIDGKELQTNTISLHENVMLIIESNSQLEIRNIWLWGISPQNFVFINEDTSRLILHEPTYFDADCSSWLGRFIHIAEGKSPIKLIIHPYSMTAQEAVARSQKCANCWL